MSLIIRTQTVTGPTFFADSTIFYAETVYVISSFKTQLDPIQNVNVTFWRPLDQRYPTRLGFTSISSYQSYSSVQMSFNTSITYIDDISCLIQTQLFGNSIFKMMKVNYIVMKVGLWGLKAYFIYHDCFQCTDLIYGNGTKSQIFKTQNINGPIQDKNNHLIQSYISGMEFMNTLNTYKKVTVQSSLQKGKAYITQKIAITLNTTLQWICIGTTIIQKDFSWFLDKYYLYRMGSFSLSKTSQSIVTTGFPVYNDYFMRRRSKFFGFSEIEVNFKKTYQLIDFKSQVFQNIQDQYQAIEAGGKLGYIFFVYQGCHRHIPYRSLITDMCYDECPTNTFVKGALCRKCHYSCGLCNGPDNVNCTSCAVSNPARIFNSVTGNCLCPVGALDRGIADCDLCTAHIANCVACSSTIVCTQCFGLLIWNSTAIACQCTGGKYKIVSQGLCSPFPGCLNSKTGSNGALCSVCDASKNFVKDAAEVCVCSSYYTAYLQTCRQKCGDGVNIQMNSTIYCDDGNLVNGDGCSSTCLVQPDYSCFNPSTYAASICKTQQSFQLKYLYVQRIITENKGIFYFSVSPSDTKFQNPSYNFLFQSSIPHSSSKTQYLPRNSSFGYLKVQIAYTQTIQDQSHFITFNFDSYFMSVSPITINFQVKGVNYGLSYDSSHSMNIMLSNLFMGVSIIIILVYLILIFMDKKIEAVELILSSQVVYLASISADSNHVNIYPMSGLRFLAGYNYISPLQINIENFYVNNLHSTATNAQFLLNLNITGLLLLIVIILVIPFKLYIKYRERERQKFNESYMNYLTEQNQKNPGATRKQMSNLLKQKSQNIKNAEQLYMKYLNKVLFPFSLLLCLPIVVYFAFQLAFISKIGKFTFMTMANVILSFIFMLLGFYFIFLVYGDIVRANKTFKFPQNLKNYPYFLILLYFVSTCLFTVFIMTNLAILILGVILLIITGYLIFFGPYKRLSINFIDAVSKLIVSLVCIGLIKILDFITNQMIFAPMAVMGLLSVNILMSIIRIIKNRYFPEVQKKILDQNQSFSEEFEKHKKQNNLKNKKQDLNQTDRQLKNKDNLQQQDISDKELMENQNQNKINQQKQNENQKDPTSQQKDDILERIKKNLREDLKNKRKQLNKNKNRNNKKSNN